MIFIKGFSSRLLGMLGIWLIFMPTVASALDWEIFANPSGPLKICLLEQIDSKTLKKLAGGRPDKRSLRKKS